MRPLFPFYGSKWNIARHYPLPRAGLVVEPFAGSAGYASFYGCPDVLLVDKDPIICGVWDYLIKSSEATIRSLPPITEVGDSVDNYELPQEAKWLIGFWLNRGSATPKKSRTAYSARNDGAQLIWGRRATERIANSLHSIRRWRVQEGDYSTAPPAATTFIDPPYGDKGKFYRIPFSDFKGLGDWALDRNGLNIVCENPTATWLPFRPLGSFKSTKGRAAEGIYVIDGGEPFGQEAFDLEAV